MAVALPTNPASTWSQSSNVPSRLFGSSDDVELYEEDEAFVLAIEMPGFDPEEIDLTWDEGRLRVAAEHVDEARDRKRTYHRTFRLPKRVEDEEIDVTYRNGVLEVSLPIARDATQRDRSIEIEG
jgi:HSP20 family protein